MTKTFCPACRHDSLYYTPDHIRCSNCGAFEQKLGWPMQVLVWTRDKTWWWRFGIWLWLIYICYRYVSDYSYPMNRLANIFNAIDFGIHELGHILFMFFGEFMHILGGSLFQVIFPVFWMIALSLKHWYFAASLCLVWIGFNLYDVATYAADARAQALPLATLSSDYESAHDWYQLLSRLGKLESDLALATTLRIFGAISVIIGLGLGLVLIGFMLFKPFRKKPEDLEKPPKITPGGPHDPNKIYPGTPHRGGFRTKTEKTY
jgi:hypothetical protein